MKSMQEMQNEILRNARFDGGWPRAVVMFPGIVALAYDEEEEKQLKSNERFAIWFGVAFGLIIWIAICFFWG
jgi:preprotein translocase subunit Sec61beta